MKKSAKTFLLFVAIFLVGAVATAGCTDGFKNWNKFGWFGSNDQQEQPSGSNTGMTNFSGVVNENGEEMKSGETYEIPKAMIYSLNSYESSTASDGIAIEARITPLSAVNKRVIYTADFANPESEWAAGKAATDYVEVIPNSEGSAKARVYCKEAFAEQIIITAASESSPEITDTCTVDYVQRITNFRICFGSNLDNVVFDIFNKDTLEIDLNIGSCTEGKGGAVGVSYVLSSVYTIKENFTQSLKFSHEITNRHFDNSSYVSNFYVPEGADNSLVVEHGDPSYGTKIYFDLRLFRDMNFTTSKVLWVNEDFTFNSDFNIDKIKELFEDDEYSLKDKVLWDISVTMKGTHATYNFTGKVIWASISGWENVRDLDIKTEDGKDNIIF